MVGTAFQITRFMTALGQGKLFYPTSSAKIIGIARGADGIGSYIQGALQRANPPRDFNSVASKIGYGDDKDDHDCAIVTTPKVRYAIVILGSPPKERTRLRQLAVAYHDCILARHPLRKNARPISRLLQSAKIYVCYSITSYIRAFYKVTDGR